MKNFSFLQRHDYITKMSEETFDLVIIGGGINGAGVAREAASRGMKVALVEAQDFASGTSSRSSKLIHGGVRYLENLEFGLVFESLSERSKLFEIAPHLVHPLRFVLPIYKHGRVGMFKMGLGMWLYDVLSSFDAPQLHERLSIEESIERVPQLNEKDLVGSYVYSDAYMDDDRLVIETLRSAIDWGALCVNYVKATGAITENGRVVGIKCHDQVGNKDFQIKARHVVSTVGVWTDELGSNLFADWKKVLRPTKGIHLTLKRDRIPIDDAVVMAVDKEKRIIFVIPRDEMIVIGTTDTDFKDHPENVKTEQEDVKYLLNVIREYFPHANITAEDIIGSYAGVRPLVDDGSDSEGKTSREHLIKCHPSNVTFVAGGKYTTYRHMAEQVIEKVLKLWPIKDRAKFEYGQTLLALNSDCTPENYRQSLLQVERWAKQYRCPKNWVQHLVKRFGMEADKILNLSSAIKHQSVWELEALHALSNTMCGHLVDFYFRRTPLFLSEPDHGLSVLPMIGRLFAENLGWSEAILQEEISQVKHQISNELEWKTSLGVKNHPDKV